MTTADEAIRRREIVDAFRDRSAKLMEEKNAALKERVATLTALCAAVVKEAGGQISVSRHTLSGLDKTRTTLDIDFDKSTDDFILRLSSIT